ncbi:MAG TPA: hypothetical protein VG387_21765 [Rhizomicrobium sp.]|jgi:hypothetical protein|nr:hypothetical protein [Rhizomicrobium sp.]
MTLADVARSTYLRTHSASDHARRELTALWIKDAAGGMSLAAFLVTMYCLL